MRKFIIEKRLDEILKYWSWNNVLIHFYKFHRYIADQISFFSIETFNYIFQFVCWNRLETGRINIFWFSNVFDICYNRMILILKWSFFHWMLDVSCFSYITLTLYYIELCPNFVKIFFKFFSNLFIRGYKNTFFN